MGGEHHEPGKGNFKVMRRYSQPAPVEQRAMDQWMQRSLKAQYSESVEEPIPDELLALVRAFPQH